VKGSCLRAAEIENVAVSTTGNCQKLGKSAIETFQMIKQEYGEKALIAKKEETATREVKRQGNA
jgi:hypothetical protein